MHEDCIYKIKEENKIIKKFIFIPTAISFTDKSNAIYFNLQQSSVYNSAATGQ